jgi:pyridoxamine 5'-phosphate oxidase
MTLATATPDGRPSARIVLLRNFDARGLVFFTNYQSRKGLELETNPRGALVFYWPEVERQIRVEGIVGRVSPQESDDYHQKRPANSRLGSVASPQSSVIGGRDVLEDLVRALGERYPEGPPRPPHWGGYRLEPAEFEFWQGRPSRLHDRLRFRLSGGKWIRERLAP